MNLFYKSLRYGKWGFTICYDFAYFFLRDI